MWNNSKNITATPTKESIIDFQCRQENPNPRGHRSSGKRGLPSFPLERWTIGLGFSCPHWISMIDFIYQSSFLSLELNHFSVNYDQAHLQATKHQIIDTVTVKKKKKKNCEKKKKSTKKEQHHTTCIQTVSTYYWVIQKSLTDNSFW